MSCEAMQENLVRRLAGDLSADESRELESHLAGCADCRAEAATLAALWSGLGELTDETPSPHLRERFEAMLASEVALAASAHTNDAPLSFSRDVRRSAKSGPAPLSSRFSVALRLAATLAFGLGLGWFFWGRGATEDIALQSLQKEVGELHEMVAQSLLARSSVSGRLEGVAYGREYSAIEPGVAAAMVQALTTDSNVNVRLAALDALRPVASGDRYRSQLVAVAMKNDSPLVSLSIIDLLLEAGTPEARRDLVELAKDTKLDPVVRGYLRERLGRSI